MLRFIKSHPFYTVIILFFVALAGLVTTAIFRENFVVSWERNVPSKHAPAELSEALESLPTWPVFHHTLKQATIRDASGMEQPSGEARLTQGVEVHYFIEPPQKQWKRFEFVGRVTEHVPGRRLALDFVGDSTGKTERLFDELKWAVEVREASPELKQKGFQSVIHGEASGRTKTWRGRLFGILSPRIVMNQVYPVDLVKFGTLERQAEARKNNHAPNYQ